MVFTETTEGQESNKPEYDRNKGLQEFDDTKAGVKGLVDTGVGRIPRIFVDEQYMLEKKKQISGKSEHSIPVIDLECLNKDAAASDEIIRKVRDACQVWGFFKVINHGIPVSVMDKVLEAVRNFHELETEIKKQYYSRDFKTKNVLYLSNMDLLRAPTASWRDTLYLKMAPKSPKPEELPQFCREIMIEYSKQVKTLGIVLFELLSEALGLKPNHMKDMHCAEGLYATGHYYPPCPEPDLTLGLHSHTDTGFLTLLLQDQIGGLQVLHENQWVNVPPSPGSLVVNIGDLMELITNGKFKSAYHRVLANVVGPRISASFVFTIQESNMSNLYGPIKELLSDENPPIYREATGEEMLASQINKGLNRSTLLSHFNLNGREGSLCE